MLIEFFHIFHKVMMDLVPYDPNLEYLFFGEEISMAMRFFSHGGIFFSPPQSVVYHLWSRDHRPTPYPDTDEIKEIKKNKRIQSQQIILDMLKGINNETLISTKYGLGTIRSIHEYEQYLRVSFQQMIVDTTDPLYHESIFANNIFEVQETNNENGNKSNYQKNIEVFNIVQSFIT